MVLRFRHLLKAHGLGEKLFQQVHAYVRDRAEDGWGISDG